MSNGRLIKLLDELLDVGPFPVAQMAFLAVEIKDVEVDGHYAQPPLGRSSAETQLGLFQPFGQCRLVQFSVADGQLVQVGIVAERVADGSRPAFGGEAHIEKNLFKATACLGEILF